MTSISQDCPYCLSKSASFALLSETKTQTDTNSWHAMATCGVCKEVGFAKLVDIVALSKQAPTGVSPMEYGRTAKISERFPVVNFYPTLEKGSIPEALPSNVLASYAEGESAFENGLFSSAGACFRKAVERALTVLHPEQAGTLHSRIRKLADNQQLPITLVDLLDHVRILGNQSVHDDEEDPTRDDCEIARDFTRLFLHYSFSLPAKIESLAKEIIPRT